MDRFEELRGSVFSLRENPNLDYADGKCHLTSLVFCKSEKFIGAPSPHPSDSPSRWVHFQEHAL